MTSTRCFAAPTARGPLLAPPQVSPHVQHARSCRAGRFGCAAAAAAAHGGGRSSGGGSGVTTTSMPPLRRRATATTTRLAAAAPPAAEAPTAGAAEAAAAAEEVEAQVVPSPSPSSPQQEQPADAPAAAAASVAAAADELPPPPPPPPKLASLPLQPVIDAQGYVRPEGVDPAHVAWVFAVYDDGRKLQYVGFSRGLRASLRTVLGRRPDKAHFFKAYGTPALDQERMLEVRQAWFDECGAPPPGNKLALERRRWQSAVDSGAVSARQKPISAAEKARELQAALRARGCTEQFVPRPELLKEGQVDFIDPEAFAAASAAAAGEAAAAAAADGADGASTSGGAADAGEGAPLLRQGTAIVDGQAKRFDVAFLMRFKANGGWMFDVKLTFDHMDSTHRIIAGRDYYEPYSVAPEAAVEAALALMLQRKMPRHLDGMLGTATFPVNYFTLGEMEQWYGEEFAAAFLAATGAELADNSNLWWRMNKIADYGAKREDSALLGVALSGSGMGPGRI